MWRRIPLTEPQGRSILLPRCHNAYRKGRYKLDPEEKRRRNDKRNYGITEEDYQCMFEQQGGVCAACGQPESRMNARIKGRLYVDHDHETAAVRAAVYKLQHCVRLVRG
jgi:recombination endonuclease VII